MISILSACMRLWLGVQILRRQTLPRSASGFPLTSVYDILFPFMVMDDDALILQSGKHNIQINLRAQTVLGRC